ncbi:MAG TPA: hypothetical protein VNM69_16735 [Bacillus sp. (in: firmicutes)]|uniref:hypothetical protein n=1 Tax=Bacillus litorisediminis TaxID=2922713 RepID=UPI001FADDBE2|nr:hypothetical protein [Bacillus litorisediminis]HWO77513.1 hypothetical protein [Bacillus sp. (in: firmicutes)]
MLAKLPIIIMFLIFIFAFFLQVLGMLQAVPLYISSPILFVAILIIISYLNERNKFKGYR